MFYIRLKSYGSWFFANFILCGVPFIVMIMIGFSQTDIFSGFLTFNYTLLVSSLYLLLQAISQKSEKMKIPIFLLLDFSFLVVSPDLIGLRSAPLWSNCGLRIYFNE